MFWSTVGETALAEGFCSNMGDTKYPRVWRRTKVPGRNVHSEIDGHRDRQEMSMGTICVRQLTVCSLFRLGTVTNQKLEVGESLEKAYFLTII